MACSSNSNSPNAEAIRSLEQILLSGVSSTSTDGESVRFEFSEIRKALAELRQNDPAAIACGSVRPRMWRGTFY